MRYSVIVCVLLLIPSLVFATPEDKLGICFLQKNATENALEQVLEAGRKTETELMAKIKELETKNETTTPVAK